MKIRNIYLIGLTLILTACSIHKIDIQQGNVMDCETIAQVKVGMSQKQVQFLIGNPTIKHPFNHQRWDYPFYFKSGKKGTHEEQHIVSILFNGDVVEHINSTIDCN